MSTRSCKSFAWCAAFCLALILMLPPPSWARPGVDGRNVTTVLTPNAQYRLLTLKRWVEEGASGSTYYFVEENRDAWSVYLFDVSRGVRLHLDLNQRQVYYADRINPKRALYPISDDSAEVKGWNVSWVASKEGLLRMTGPNQWVGLGTDGNTHSNFVEEGRDEWSVYLYEPSRGMRLHLDLSSQQVFISDRSGPKRALHSIAAVSAFGVPRPAAPPVSASPATSYPPPPAAYPSPSPNTVYLGNPPLPSVTPGYPAYPYPPENAGYPGSPPSATPLYPAYSPEGPVPVACSAITCGSVEAVNVQQIAGDSGAVGAIIGGLAGAALGSRVGRGSGRDVATIAGAVAGAIAGHQIERSAKSGLRYDVAVRMDDGSVRTFFFDAVPPFRVGDRVRDTGGSLQPN